MSDSLCPSCGNRNPPNTQFCKSCGEYLGWVDEKTGIFTTGPRPIDPVGHGAGGNGVPGRGATGQGSTGRGATGHAGSGDPTIQARATGQQWGGQSGSYGWEAVRPEPSQGGVRTQSSASTQTGGADVDRELRVEVEQSEILGVTPGAAPIFVTVHIANRSKVVEAYRVAAVGAPPWLKVTPGEVRLYPSTDERIQIGIAIPADPLVPVQRFRVTLRVQGESSQLLTRDVFVGAAVGEVRTPAQLRLEPSNLRVKDQTAGGLKVTIDNSGTNVPRTFELSASDPEQEVRFAFQPPRLAVPWDGSATAQLWFHAPLPSPGEQINRTLTVTARSEDQELTANAGFNQVASALVVDPPVVLHMDPSVVHADRRVGVSHIVLDNRRGSRPQRIHLEARDVENSVRFVIEPQGLEVPAGQYAMAKLTMRAPRPEAGESKTWPLVIAAWNGQQSIETQGQLVQERAEQRPFLRVLLTLLGSLGMIFGALLPFTVDADSIRRTGVQWNHPTLPSQLGISTAPVDGVLEALGVSGLVSALVSVGSIIIVLGVLAALGIFGTSGKLIRRSAVWGVIVLLLFFGAMVASFFRGQGMPALQFGWGIVLTGCVLAFIGSYFARPW